VSPAVARAPGIGSPVIAHEPEARKVVTVLFTDVAGSTALGEQLDPELLRRVMWRLETRNGHVAGHDEIDAVALAREAAEQETGNADITAVAQTLVDVSEVLVVAGDHAGAEAALTDAIALNEEKGNIVAAQQGRERLAR
jgi:class 3 adenylate cyclase